MCHKTKLTVLSNVFFIILLLGVVAAVEDYDEELSSDLADLQRPRAKSFNSELTQPGFRRDEPAKTTHLQAKGSSTSDYNYMVVGGYHPKTDFLAKYTVSIATNYYSNFFGDQHFCGGTIISPNLILTAAHCLVGDGNNLIYESNQLNVITGAPNRLIKRNTTQVVGVREQMPHPKFDSNTLVNDIALLVLEDDLRLDDHTQTMVLPHASPQPDQTCTVVGWGRIMDDGPMPAELLYADVKIWSKESCRATGKQASSAVLCANNPDDNGVDACTGDSGGPLICDNSISGVVSYGFGCAVPGIPGFYTDVYQYINFIVYHELGSAMSHQFSASLLCVLVVSVLVIW